MIKQVSEHTPLSSNDEVAMPKSVKVRLVLLASLYLYYYFCYFPYKQITMNVVLQIQSVTTMPSVRIITVLMFVLVKLGLQEMEKHVMVR